MKLTEDQWKEGLIVRSPNWLGDLVMSFPALMLLKQILPQFCGLTVVCPANLAPFLAALETTVDEIIPLSDPHAFPTGRELAPIRRRKYGAGILFNNSLRDAIIFRTSGIHPIVGAAARGRSFLLRERIRFPKRIMGRLNPPHQAERYAAIAELLGADKWDGVSVPPIFPEYSAADFQTLTGCSFPSGPVLAIAPGAAFGDAKRWNASRFREVANTWLQQTDGAVFLLGSKAEETICFDCAEGLCTEKVFNLAGKTSPDSLMFILSKTDYCLANDSGIMHLAAAIGIPGTAVFGSTDMAATSPISKNWSVLYHPVPCSPCFRRVCPNGTRTCMEQISVEEVLSSLPSFSSRTSS